MPTTTTSPRDQLRELDDRIRRCRDEILARDPGTDDDRQRAQDLALGALTARRIVTLQWL